MRYRLIATLCCLLITIPLLSQEEEQFDDLFPSTPEQVAALSSESNYLIGGLINPLSGQIALRQTDLIVNGAQKLTLSRIYIPPYIAESFPQHKKHNKEYSNRYLYHHLKKNYKGWRFYPHLSLKFNAESKIVRLTDPSGMTLDFQLSDLNESTTTLITAHHALSNTAGDSPSGKYDPRNTRISYEATTKKITVFAIDGCVRIYHEKVCLTDGRWLYLLDKEILSSGKIIKYYYHPAGKLDRIESMDPQERYTYASIRMTGSIRGGNCRFTSSTKLNVDYNFQKKPIQWKIKEKIRRGTSREEMNIPGPSILTSVSSPFYRDESLKYCAKYLLDSYSGKDDIFTVVNGCFGADTPHYQVHQLSLPVGPNDTFLPVYELNYDPSIAEEKEGRTTVKNSDGISTIYLFSKNLLTTAIQYFDQEKNLKKEKVLSLNYKLVGEMLLKNLMSMIFLQLL